MTSTLEKRISVLEDASGGGGGCDRCRGTLVVVEDAVTGAFHRASCNGAELTEEELHDRKAERECPRCGRRIDPTEALEIRVGGQRRPERK
jgi:predicted ATPase